MNVLKEKRERRLRRKLTRRCCPKCLAEPLPDFVCCIPDCPRVLVEMRRSRRAWEFPEETQNTKKTG